MSFEFRNYLPSHAWPAFGDAFTNQVLALCYQFERSQWFSLEQVQFLQQKQLVKLVQHAMSQSKYYQDLYSSKGIQPSSVSNIKLQDLPIITRQQVQQYSEDIFCQGGADFHGELSQCLTSGSTGTPISIHSTELCSLVWHALSMRDHEWQARNFNKKFAIIKHTNEVLAKAPHGVKVPFDKATFTKIYQDGSLNILNIDATVKQQFDWLHQQKPSYFFTYPSNLKALINYAGRVQKPLPAFEQVATLGEMLDPDVRELCKQSLSCALKDVYSCQELGYIAIQCPEHEHYHVMSENVIVEILDNKGRPCLPGETGRVVLTSLHNFATPLIRYDIGDFAEVGSQCSCGRELPVLNKIMGRSRNMITYPNGDQRWPFFGTSQIVKMYPITQMKIIQTDINNLTVQLVCQTELSNKDLTKIKTVIQNALKYGFNIEFEMLSSIPRLKSGKFEEFTSLL